MAIGQSAGKSWSYLVGVYLGDGCVTTHQGRLVFRLNTIDQDFAEATKGALAEFTDKPIAIHRHPVSKSSKDNFALRCGDALIAARLCEETAGKQRLPEWIWTASHVEKLAFIAGLMDSEGFVSQNGRGSTYMGFKSTDVWFDDFIRLLNSAGIEIGKIGVEKPRMEHYRTPKRFHIKLESWVRAGGYFNIARKQARVDRWRSANLRDYTQSAAQAVMI